LDNDCTPDDNGLGVGNPAPGAEPRCCAHHSSFTAHRSPFPSLPSRWARITVECPPAAAEAVAAIVVDLIGYGVQIDEIPGVTRVHGFVSETEDADAIEELIRQRVSAVIADAAGSAEMTISRTWIEESDWAGSLSGREAFRVGQHFVIAFADENEGPIARPAIAEPDSIVIELQSQMAFGTGDHQTTALCLEALERLIEPGDRVLDVGTGSGILSIAAARLGAADVLGVDNDPTAVAVAQAHCARNAVTDTARILAGEGMQHATGLYDIVVANVLATVIGPLAPVVARHMKPGGYYIASGATYRCENELKEDLTEAGFVVCAVDRRDDWICLIARYPEG
jgi:ribosomal protein L11 methyltransferase